MQILSKHSSGLKLKQDALKISSDAKKAKKNNPDVIDATLGTFIQDDGKFKAFNVVDKILKNFKDEDYYTYSSSDGGEEFKNAVLNWVFGQYKDNILSSLYSEVIATPGGTGAISSSVYNSLDQNQTLLIPNLCWGPYNGIAKKYGLNVVKFNLFKNNKFNISEFKEKANEIIDEQNKLVVILNDPCNNPTGYTMSEEELNEIISFFNSKKDVPCILIYDIAYIDFAYEGTNKTRKKFQIFNSLSKNSLVSICFSASKSFSVYGQRLGAQIMLSKNNEAVLDFYNASNFCARNTWSNSNKSIINLLNILVKDEEMQKQYYNELNESLSIMKKRSDLFIQEANDAGLEIYPYQSGFFVTIPCSDTDLTIDMLRDEMGIYLIPFDKSVRVSLCSLPLQQIKGLAKKIKYIIEKIKSNTI